MAKLYTYMIGIEPSDWDFNDTKACKKYGLTCKGYYKLGDNEGMVLVGELDNIEDIMEMYFGLEIVDEYLCPIDEFDYEDGRWVTGGWTESKKFVRKSLKEGIDVKIVYSDDTPSEYIDDVTHNDILEIIEESPEVYKIFDISGSKKKLIWSDEYGFERAYESKKSMKEGKDSAFYDGIAKEFHFSKDEKTRYKDKTYISAIAVLFDRINNAIKTYGRNSDEEYNTLNDCWEVISSAKQNGFNVDYDEDRWNKIAGLPNYH